MPLLRMWSSLEVRATKISRREQLPGGEHRSAWHGTRPWSKGTTAGRPNQGTATTKRGGIRRIPLPGVIRPCDDVRKHDGSSPSAPQGGARPRCPPRRYLSGTTRLGSKSIGRRIRRSGIEWRLHRNDRRRAMMWRRTRPTGPARVRPTTRSATAGLRAMLGSRKVVPATPRVGRAARRTWRRCWRRR